MFIDGAGAGAGAVLLVCPVCCPFPAWFSMVFDTTGSILEGILRFSAKF
jgi:hypothetical protein